MNQTDQMDALPRQTSLVVALVPAAGRGLRMGGSVPKQFLSLGGEPLVIQSLRALQAAPVVGQIILAVPPADVEYCEHEIVSRQRFTKVTKVVAGGAERQDSVRYALAQIPSDTEIVLIHDAVRPFVTLRMIAEVVAAARKEGAAIIALPTRDTVKQVRMDGMIERTVDRTPCGSLKLRRPFDGTGSRPLTGKRMPKGCGPPMTHPWWNGWGIRLRWLREVGRTSK